jgi:hypothetical protein
MPYQLGVHVQRNPLAKERLCARVKQERKPGREHDGLGGPPRRLFRIGDGDHQRKNEGTGARIVKSRAQFDGIARAERILGRKVTGGEKETA